MSAAERDDAGKCRGVGVQVGVSESSTVSPHLSETRARSRRELQPFPHGGKFPPSPKVCTSRTLSKTQPEAAPSPRSRGLRAPPGAAGVLGAVPAPWDWSCGGLPARLGVDLRDLPIKTYTHKKHTSDWQPGAPLGRPPSGRFPGGQSPRLKSLKALEPHLASPNSTAASGGTSTPPHFAPAPPGPTSASAAAMSAACLLVLRSLLRMDSPELITWALKEQACGLGLHFSNKLRARPHPES